jgi:hypothetical protein
MRRGMIGDSQRLSEGAKVDIYYSARESWLDRPRPSHALSSRRKRGLSSGRLTQPHSMG